MNLLEVKSPEMATGKKVENEATIKCVTSQSNVKKDNSSRHWSDECGPDCSSMGSDIFYKQEISGIKKGETLDKLMRLNPVTYRYKQCYFEYQKRQRTQDAPETDMTKDIRFGFIAQELQKVYPELVHTNKEGYLSVNYIDLISILIDAVKSLNEEVIELKKQITC